MRRYLLASMRGAAALVALVTTERASASACCGGDATLGQRLAPDERAAANLSATFEERFGGYDGAGRYRSLQTGDADHALRFDAEWTVRGSSRFEIGVDVPVLVDVRSIGGQDSSGAGFGDVRALGRVTVVPVDPLTLWPALFVTASVIVPTGRPPHLADSAAEVTGQGVPEFALAATVAKTFSGKWFAEIDGSVSFFGPSNAGGVEVARAPRFRAALVTGPVIDYHRELGVALGAGVLYEAEPAPLVDGTRGVSGVRRLRALLSGDFDVAREASILVSIASDLPVSNVGANQAAGVAFSLGGRYAWETAP